MSTGDNGAVGEIRVFRAKVMLAKDWNTLKRLWLDQALRKTPRRFYLLKKDFPYIPMLLCSVFVCLPTCAGLQTSSYGWPSPDADSLQKNVLLFIQHLHFMDDSTIFRAAGTARNGGIALPAAS